MEFLVPVFESWEYKTIPILHTGWLYPIILVVLYYTVVIQLIPRYMLDKKPFDLRWPLIIWNSGLWLFSVTWAVWLLFLAGKVWYNEGYYTVICDPNAKFWKGQAVFVVWGFLMSKFIEFGDTVNSSVFCFQITSDRFSLH
jgi:hypothetical protein